MAAEHQCTPGDVLRFWREAGPKRWFKKDDAFDARFRDTFLAAHQAAARGELDAWSSSAEGALALLILLDQFPRNAFRDTARVYATDEQARAVARAAIDAGYDRQVEPALRGFFYLPFEHSEHMEDQELAVALTRDLDGDAHKWAVHHRDIVARFGRFPHRNEVLGRDSTPDERRYIQEGGFAG